MNIYEFLKTGVLGQLSVKYTEEVLRQNFGAGVLGDKLFPDKAYNDVYYYYAYGGVLEICVSFGEVSHFNVTIYENFFYIEYADKKHYLSEVNTFPAFTDLLDAMKINWTFLSKYSFGKQLAIITEGNVVIVFTFNDQEKSADKFQINLNDRFERA
ncbi:hypothetical protein BKI52_18230 [marine bacterium AO1-C]|nr:hypothetical protein BKI52_18230 [marine bacterium AO1-C]